MDDVNFIYDLGEDSVIPTKEEIDHPGFKDCFYKDFYKIYLPDIETLPNINLNPSNKNITDLVTFAVHNPDIVYHHCRLIKKYIKSPYHHTVVINVHKDSHEMMKICKEFGCTCIELPNYPKGINSNYVQGFLFNYIYEEYLKRRQCKYFGFLDFDIFYYKDFDVVEALNGRDCCGRAHGSGHYEDWFLWGGYSFFELDKFQYLDYTAKNYWETLPGPYYEAGGRNHYLYFYNRNWKDYELVKDIGVIKYLRIYPMLIITIF